MQAADPDWLLAQPRTLLGLLATLLFLLLALVLLNWRQWRSGQLLSRRRQKLQGPLDPADLALAAGLVSRDQFDQSLEAAAVQADQSRRTLCVLVVSLDKFELINDLGDSGDADRVLAQAAQRLRLCAGATVTIARLGVDEFVLLLPGDLSAAGRLAGDCRARLGRPFTVAGQKQTSLQVSIGMAAYPQHGASGRLVVFAGHAMQAVKRAGGDDVMVFAPQLAVDAHERSELVVDLRQALALAQFELVYLPRVEARSLQIIVAEALIHWRHPLRGLVSPALFIPLAERHGLIAEIGHWVIDETCRQAAVWRDQGLHLRVAIKLSGCQMRQDDLVDQLQAALQYHHLLPSLLTCEIAESVVIEDSQATRRCFERLGEVGLQVAIDDFGVGESGLDRLRQLPLAELKIDAGLVRDVHSSEQARSMVSAVVHLGHALGLHVVAQGVETPAQRDRLVALGCDALQGDLFAKPMTALALATWALLDASDAAVTAAWRESPLQHSRPVDE